VRVAWGGGQPLVLGESGGSIAQQIALDDSNIYWTAGFSQTVLSMPRCCTPPQ
jgi:hypothetical protein